MNRKNFIGLASMASAFSVLLPRESRITESSVGRIRITLMNPHAEEIRDATITLVRSDFELQENGRWDYGETYINKKDLKFPLPEYDWGEVHGFSVSDMDGKVIFKTRFDEFHSIKRGSPVSFQAGHFFLSLTE